MTTMRFSKLPALALLALWPAVAPAIVTFTVNDTADHPDDIHDGVCADVLGKCTLRAAIMEANLGTEFTGYDIVLPAGTYTLTRAVASPDNDSNGDLDVTNGIVRIHGAGAAKTIIDANHVDRAFKVTSGNSLRLFNLTIRNGLPSSALGRFDSGGAILVPGDLYLEGCVLDSNSTPHDGGAIMSYLVSGTPDLNAIRSTFSRNIAGGGGGALYASQVNATFDSCTFSSNTSGFGAGLALASSTLYMQNTTFSLNDAANDGGGMHLYNVAASIYNCTFGENGADTDVDNNGVGGGMLVEASNVMLSNSVFANLNFNTHGDDDCYTVSSTIAFGGINQIRSLVGCSYTGLAIEADPLLGPLKDNGGPTQTSMLSPTSVAIGSGPAGGCPGISAALTVDQRGVKRPIGAKCDLGAVEVEPIGDVNGDGSVTLADVFYLINFLFAGGPLPHGRANVNGGSTIDVADVFYLINYLFAGGPAPV